MTLHPKKCPTGKKCFSTAIDAEPYLEEMRRREHPARAKRLHLYTCRVCLWLHIGHDFGREMTRTQRRGKHRRSADRHERPAP